MAGHRSSQRSRSCPAQGRSLAVGAARPRRAPKDFVSVFARLGPELDDHVFTVEVEQWVSQDRRVRRRKGPKVTFFRASAVAHGQTSVCASWDCRALSPPPAATRVRESLPTRERQRPSSPFRRCLGHSRPDTTQGYTDELDLHEIAEALTSRGHRLVIHKRRQIGRRSKRKPQEGLWSP